MIICTFSQIHKIINTYKIPVLIPNNYVYLLQLPIFLFNWNFVDENYKIFSFYDVIFSSISIRIKLIALLMEMQL
jgi:hypothetical protein